MRKKPGGFSVRRYTLLSILLLSSLLLGACSAAENGELPAEAGVTITPMVETQTVVETQADEGTGVPDTSIQETPVGTGEEASTEFVEPGPEETAEPASINCTSPASRTPSMTEGPYYKADSPERISLLEPGIPGETLVLTGFVLNTNCEPVPNAWIDFWQTDGNGEYDNAGYKLRGHQFTDENGQYILETVVPGLYPGRTAHIHVKVQAPDEPVLTTQLFIPGEPGNERDMIFSEDLVIDMQETEDGLQGTFNFVLNVD